MPTYYFDLKDGVRSHDTTGIQFPTPAAAIAHSKELARTLRSEPRIRADDLSIIVLDEGGTEVHRESVYPENQGLAHIAR